MRCFFICLFFLSGCGAVALPEYQGSREAQDLATEIMKRFGWQTFLGAGTGKVYEAKEDEKHSFDFEVRIDRHRWGHRGFALILSKTLGGTLFEITSHKERHLFADYTARPPGWMELSGNVQFQALGGATLKVLRTAMVHSWPPSGDLRETSEGIEWGPWLFDQQTLAIKSYTNDKFVWSFEDWQVPESGFWRSLKWRFQVADSYMELYFHEDEIEEELRFTKWDFELDTSAIGPLKKVAE